MKNMVAASLLAAALLSGGVRAADVVDTAAATGEARTMVEAVQSVGLAGSLRAPGPFTMFAPTDEAWAQLPAETVERLLADKALLTEVLKYHVVPGKLDVDELRAGTIKSVQGQPIEMVKGSSGWQVGGANVVKAAVEADNGVVYLIDTVIFPK
jgi:uncharacterized surface protein with fasciclin (FAS1) repeats